jgi:predicted TIM-barrel fold metal-dependent hydrolase
MTSQGTTIEVGEHAPFLDRMSERQQTSGLLPDPEPREVRYTVISVDDHLVEPPGMFEGRLAARFAAQAPHVITTDEGYEAWEYDGKLYRQVGLNAVAGRPKEEWLLQSTTFGEIRKGCYDVHERIKDMDIDGVWASVNFPSQITGFCGSVFARTKDAELGLAVTKAWNDWMFEEWYGAYPERVVPMGITWLTDPEIGAAEIRRNAARGFTAVTLPEQPHKLGLPSIFSGYWDPILRACEETDTVVCLHVGSTGLMAMPEDSPMLELGATLFGALSLATCAEWLWSGVTLRFPKLKVALSEGGIGWVPMLLDRLEYMFAQSGHDDGAWPSSTITPTESLLETFYFCTIDDPSIWPIRDRIGVDHIMIESDYPHADSTWPDTQAFVERRLGNLPVEDIRKLTHLNAAKLFRHPLPAITLPTA